MQNQETTCYRNCQRSQELHCCPTWLSLYNLTAVFEFKTLLTLHSK